MNKIRKLHNYRNQMIQNGKLNEARMRDFTALAFLMEKQGYKITLQDDGSLQIAPKESKL